ncbi:hypothetical protein EHS15_01255 [Leptospira idonii]|uniref:Uncharacterized protein n=1 Tax=Leptospira idonii TaxID=1193500 RepID=A0A4R9M2C3_9LEPT|nr:hypothetical protein EHS15_01255 [Leptospira idonii]
MILILFLILPLCKPKKKDEVDPQLLSYLLTQKTGAEGACQKFLLSESYCISAPDNSVVVCPSLVANLRSKILPTEKNTDAIAELYFNCFTDVNLVYNQGINCQKTSFNTTADYRRAQRGTSSGSSQNAVAAWKTQFNNCASLENGIPPASSGLRETETKLSGDPFF